MDKVQCKQCDNGLFPLIISNHKISDVTDILPNVICRWKSVQMCRVKMIFDKWKKRILLWRKNTFFLNWKLEIFRWNGCDIAVKIEPKLRKIDSISKWKLCQTVKVCSENTYPLFKTVETWQRFFHIVSSENVILLNWQCRSSVFFFFYLSMSVWFLETCFFKIKLSCLYSLFKGIKTQWQSII